jgi:hypothetical protein
MIYDSEYYDESILRTHYEEFKRTLSAFYISIKREYLRIKDDKGKLKIFKKKYPFFEKDTNRREYIYKLFEYKEFHQFKENENFKKYLFKILIRKIPGVYKHGQSGKTEICCEKILADLHQNRLTIAITKNTLLANKQFTSRFVKCMTSRFGLKSVELRNSVIVISSEKNDLGGNATHCKNIQEAWESIYTNENKYSVIFVCANSTRIDDVTRLLENFESPVFNSKYIKDIVIQYDEAHNTSTGIPVYRELIENMLIYDFVKELVPISASKNTLDQEENPLWRKENLEKNRIDFRNKELVDSLVTSESPHYSSVKDFFRVSFEDHFSYTKTYDNHISFETFDRIYHNEPTKYSTHGKLDAFNMPQLGQEHIAVNAAKQILENQSFSYDRLYGSDIRECTEPQFLKNTFNLHIIITPGRKIVTRYIMEHAVLMPYKPVVIGLYGSAFHYMYIDDTGIIKSVNEGKPLDKTKEFNDMLVDFLKERDLLNRCVILMGNYLTLGESNTFVHNEYGYVRSVNRLPGCHLSIEQDYQFFLRGCFLLKRFDKLKKDDIIKFMIAPQECIDNAEYYEELNDKLVTNERDVSEIEDESIPIIDYVPKIVEPTSYIPVKYIILDPEHTICIQIIEIKKKTRRNAEDKGRMMMLIQEGIKEGIIEVVDNNSPQINISDYTLTEFRCYTKPDEESVENTAKNDNWRFKTYNDYVDQKQPFSNGELTTKQCGLYCSTVMHTHSKNGHRHSPYVMYMLFSK